MSGLASPLFLPPAPPGVLALVTGEANFVFGKFSSPEDLSGQVCGVSVTPASPWGKKHQELRKDQALGVHIPHPGVPQNQGQQNSELASLLFAFWFLESSFGAARIYI